MSLHIKILDQGSTCRDLNQPAYLPVNLDHYICKLYEYFHYVKHKVIISLHQTITFIKWM